MVYTNRLAQSLMLPTITHCSITQKTAMYFERCSEKLLTDVSNVCQTSVDFVLFEFYVSFRGHLKDWFKIRMKNESSDNSTQYQ